MMNKPETNNGWNKIKVDVEIEIGSITVEKFFYFENKFNNECMNYNLNSFVNNAKQNFKLPDGCLVTIKKIEFMPYN